MTELDWEEFRCVAATVDTRRLADGGKSGTVPGKTIPCPLRQLAEWLDRGESMELYMRKTDDGKRIKAWAFDMGQSYPENEGLSVEGYGATTLEAAADAVRQLKEKGEL